MAVDVSRAVSAANGLSEEHRLDVLDLVKTWQARMAMNAKRTRYYEGKVSLDEVNIGIAIKQEALDALDVRSDWVEKAMSAITERVQLDGFVCQDGTDGGLKQAVDVESLIADFEQVETDALVHGVAFATVTAGGPNERPAVVNFHDATEAAGLWDSRSKRIRAGIVVAEMERHREGMQPEPVVFNVYEPDCVIVLTRNADKVNWTASYKDNPAGRPLIEPIVFNPATKHPFGQSAVTRGLMSIEDRHIREVGRLEIAREVNATPQKWMMGADDAAFDKSRYEMYIGMMMLASKDEDGDVPTVGQFPQVQVDSMQLRTIAMEFSGASSVPLCDLGFDANSNPSSAEAIYAQKESLVIRCNKFIKRCSIALSNIARLCLAVANDVPLGGLDDNSASIRPVFSNPSAPSLVTQADAMVKVASVAPWVAETDVFLEELGFDESKRIRMQQARARAQAQAALERFVNEPDDSEPDDDELGVTEEAEEE